MSIEKCCSNKANENKGKKSFKKIGLYFHHGILLLFINNSIHFLLFISLILAYLFPTLNRLLLVDELSIVSQEF